MSQSVNERVPSPRPEAGTYNTLDASQPNSAGRSGVIFATAVRSLTGASGGSASGAYTSQSIYNPTARGIRLYLFSSGAATGTSTLKVQVFDPASLLWTDLPGAVTLAMDGTGAASTGPYTLTIYPGLTIAATGAAFSKVDQHLGIEWRAVLTVALATATCSVGADYLM